MFNFSTFSLKHILSDTFCLELMMSSLRNYNKFCILFFQNVLELTVYDEDFATPDDHLLCALFDTAKLPLDKTVILSFKASPNVRATTQLKQLRNQWRVTEQFQNLSEPAMDYLPR